MLRGWIKEGRLCLRERSHRTCAASDSIQFDSTLFDLGIESSVHISYSRCGRGLHVDQPRGKDAVLMVVPLSSCFTSSSSAAMGERQRLASIASQLMGCDSKEPLGSYVSQLMPGLDQISSLMMFSDDERHWLQIPHLIEVAARESKWASESSLGSGGRKALALANSRSFSFQRGREWLSILPPGIDMANHNQGANASVFLDGDNLVLQSLKPLDEGEEVCIDYGSRSNLLLLRDYGFIVEGNEEDRIPFDTSLTPLNKDLVTRAARQLLTSRQSKADTIRIKVAFHSLLPFTTNGVYHPSTHSLWSKWTENYLSQFSSVEEDERSLKSSFQLLSSRKVAAIRARLEVKKLYQMALIILSSPS
jgi:hypothetical protein